MFAILSIFRILYGIYEIGRLSLALIVFSPFTLIYIVLSLNFLNSISNDWIYMHAVNKVQFNLEKHAVSKLHSTSTADFFSLLFMIF